MRSWLITIAIGICFTSHLADAETTHVVKKNDTLYAISRTYNIPLTDILKSNPGLNPQQIKIGQRLKIPTTTNTPPPTQTQNPTPPTPPPQTDPTFHIVKKGDTLATISRTYNIPLEELKSRNQLKSNILFSGQKIILRTPPPPQPTTPPKPPTEKTPEYIFVSKVRNKIESPAQFRPWQYIVIHHSGTPSGNAKIFNYFHSQVRGMENGLAYHFVIGNGTDSGDGAIEVGNRWLRQIQGGHLASDELNEIAIGICLVGEFNKTRPTKAQIASLIELISYLQKRAPGKPPKFMLHREINPKPTDCPGKQFPGQALHKLFDAKE